jgi:hypothetical protein
MFGLQALRRATMALAALCLCAGSGDAARADEVPPAGTYMIRQFSGPKKPGPGGHYIVSQYLVLRPGGVYEVYYFPSKELRSRGNYRIDADGRRFVWLSGVNHEMGRSGAWSTTHDGFPSITLGRNTEAVKEK